MKVKEIFFSYQAEGIYIGMPTIFVRFAGCNLKCYYCDTKFAQKLSTKDEQKIENVYNKIYSLFKKYHPQFISFTGGEPLLQKSLPRLVKKIKQSIKIKTYLETNATLVNMLKRLINYIDIFCINLKLPIDDKNKKNVLNLTEKFVKICNSNKKKFFIKLVVSKNLYDQSTLKLIEQFFINNKVETLVLQPETKSFIQNNKNVFRNISLIFNRVRKNIKYIYIIPQLHKFIWKIK